MKKFLFISVWFFFLINFGEKRLDKGYIRIEFGADPAKPFPVITFYLPQSIDTSYKEDHIHNIEISKSEFSLIRKIIMPLKSTEPKTTKMSFLQYPKIQRNNTFGLVIDK